jgi:hypothetical protein
VQLTFIQGDTAVLYLGGLLLLVQCWHYVVMLSLVTTDGPSQGLTGHMSAVAKFLFGNKDLMKHAADW